LDLFRFPRPDVVGKSIAIIHPSEESFQQFDRIARPFLKEQGWWRGEWEFRDADQEPVLAEAAHSLLADGQGTPLGFNVVLRDIKGRREREEQIRSQQTFLEQILEAISHPLYVIDAETHIVRLANSASGVKDLIGRATCYELTHRRKAPCSGEDHPCPLAEVKKTGKPVTVEHRHFDRSGNLRIFEVHGFPVFDADGKLLQTIEYALDITDRKEAEKALREREAHLRLLTDQMPAILWSVDRELRILSSSGSGLKALGLSPDQIVGKSLVDFFSPPEPDSPYVAAHHRALLGRHEEFELEWRNQYFQVRLEPLFDELGKITGVIGIGLDITDRQRLERELVNYKDHLEQLVHQRTAELEKEMVEKKAAESTLRESEERYRKTIEAAPYAITISRIGDGKFLQVNKFFCDLSGYTPEEVVGRTPLELGLFINPEDREQFINLLQEKGGIDGFERRYRLKDGRIIDALLSARPLQLAGEDCLVSVVMDITDRKREQAEKEEMAGQLRQAQKMEALGALAGGIAHDFNNILTVIMGNAEMAQIELPPDSAAHFSLSQVVEGGLHAKELVKQILNFSRKRPIERKALKVGSLIKEALKLIRASLPSSIEIRQQFDYKSDIIQADPIQVYQVLLNLCTNALQALRDQVGFLEVGLTDTTREREQPSVQPFLKPGAYIKLSVRDNGPGMPPEVLKRACEPYFTTKEKGVGTGLGLAVTQAIIQDHGGCIQIESDLGRGTVATVFFPLVEGEAAAALSSEATPPRGQEKILLVDDEEWIVDLGARLLRHLGYEVTGMTGSLQALEFFRNRHPDIDLVLTDLTMPNLTGDKMAREMLRLKPGLPIILLTGFPEMVTEEKVRAEGIRALAFKPLLMNELAALIRRVLDFRKCDG
ncbi:MAG: PAS domain S-box protein, partial [Deltaproteobacteria bacterium]|nr:PAS domain S-box protein [Deltaproteobacteria bacterium]